MKKQYNRHPVSSYRRQQQQQSHRNNDYIEQNSELFTGSSFEYNDESNPRSLLGKPPYEFVNGGSSRGIQKRSVDRKKSNLLDPEYQRKYPNPNYYNFGKPQFVDGEGREYRLAQDDNSIKKGMVDKGIITKSVDLDRINREGTNFGTQMLWMKIPSKKRKSVFDSGSVLAPDASGEKLILYDYVTQTPFSATTNSVYLGSKRKTGYVLLDNFVSLGKSADPSRFEKNVVVAPKKTPNEHELDYEQEYD